MYCKYVVRIHRVSPVTFGNAQDLIHMRSAVPAFDPDLSDVVASNCVQVARRVTIGGSTVSDPFR